MKFAVHAMMAFEVEADTAQEAANNVRARGGDVRGLPEPLLPEPVSKASTQAKRS